MLSFGSWLIIAAPQAAGAQPAGSSEVELEYAFSITEVRLHSEQGLVILGPSDRPTDYGISLRVLDFANSAFPSPFEQIFPNVSYFATSSQNLQPDDNTGLTEIAIGESVQGQLERRLLVEGPGILSFSPDNVYAWIFVENESGSDIDFDITYSASVQIVGALTAAEFDSQYSAGSASFRYQIVGIDNDILDSSVTLADEFYIARPPEPGSPVSGTFLDTASTSGLPTGASRAVYLEGFTAGGLAVTPVSMPVEVPAIPRWAIIAFGILLLHVSHGRRLTLR